MRVFLLALCRPVYHRHLNFCIVCCVDVCVWCVCRSLLKCSELLWGWWSEWVVTFGQHGAEGFHLIKTSLDPFNVFGPTVNYKRVKNVWPNTVGQVLVTQDSWFCEGHNLSFSPFKVFGQIFHCMPTKLGKLHQIILFHCNCIANAFQWYIKKFISFIWNFRHYIMEMHFIRQIINGSAHFMSILCEPMADVVPCLRSSGARFRWRTRYISFNPSR